VNLKDGTTVSFDLKDPVDHERWKQMAASNSFQNEMTGVGIIFNSHWYTLPLPKRFRQISFQAELVENSKKDAPPDRRWVGERVKVYVDDVLVSLLVYYGNRPRMSRIDVVKVGKRRYNPELKG